MGRDVFWYSLYLIWAISTHTPAWGVTLLYSLLRCGIMISTHTPAWGVTAAGLSAGTDHSISTHTPAWGVTHNPLLFWPRFWISTHTPAWGVTLPSALQFSVIINFNSHARVGRDF